MNYSWILAYIYWVARLVSQSHKIAPVLYLQLLCTCSKAILLLAFIKKASTEEVTRGKHSSRGMGTERVQSIIC